ncbi:hypothetical protein BBP00_00004244 [Phytophthora kernoviae]|uniref:Autophagy-related protein 2 n=1 Tax=Phytophthora kernoviae TaxID=325452 RepID=A0A3F2RU62_9STRA|nr:hypothetical protein BBP00_00004244 [Phytophthora kernoviae]
MYFNITVPFRKKFAVTEDSEMQFFKQLTDPALKRLYKFVLKRMIGRFLAVGELDLDQLDVHLRSGRLELCDLLLNADVLNAELCEAQGLPFKVKKGYLGSVRVAISYANIMSESCLVEIDDIEIILVPLDSSSKQEETQVRQSGTGGSSSSTGESSPKAETSTDSTAEKKCTIPEPVDEISQEGLDFVASWIEQVTSKIKITLSNICLRLETGEQHNGHDVALLCKLQWAQFTDESASEVQSVYGRSSLDHTASMYRSQTTGGGMQSMAASTLFGISQKGIKFRGVSMDLHLSSGEEGEEDRWTDRRRTEYNDMVLHPFLASDPTKQCYIQVKLSHYEALRSPAMDADVFFHSIRIVLQPQYFPELGTLIDAFSADPAKLNAHRVDNRLAYSQHSLLALTVGVFTITEKTLPRMSLDAEEEEAAMLSTLGLNGWNLDALGRAEAYETAAAAAALYSVEIGLPCANAVLFKSSLARLMVLFDALLMINPIDVDSYNQMLAAVTLRNRLMPSYMTLNLTLGEGTTNEMREMKVELNLSHLSLRYDVRSKWLFQMLDMLLMDYPMPIIPLDSATMSDEESGELFNTVKRGGSYEAVPLAVPPKTVFTKLFVNFYDVIVDYAPPTLSSRVILVLGKISVSSNVVTGAVMQGYKISAGDLELFLTHSRASYDEIDEAILGNELFLRSNPNTTTKKVLKFTDTYRRSSGSLDATYPSLLTFLEKFGFLQIVTMDFVDVFLRVLVPPSALDATSASRVQLKDKAPTPPAPPEMSVELNLGTANIYACFDSFNTLIELLSVWTEQLVIEQEPRDSTAYDEDAGASEVSVDDFPLFEPVEDKPVAPLPVSPDIYVPVNLEQINASASDDNSCGREDADEDDDFDANHFPMGAFPAASKNWWGMQNRLDEVELSDLQTEETASSFSHRMDFLEDKSTTHMSEASAEIGGKSAGEVNGNDMFPNALSMSIIDTGEDEGKEIELDFALDSDLQSRFNRLLEMESNSSHEVDDLEDDNGELEQEQNMTLYGQLQREAPRRNRSLRLDVFNDDDTQSLASHTVLALGDMELLDYISTSQIRKIICYWKSEATHPRESGSSMVRLQLITVRPGPNLCEEHRLKARLLPLRINLDQEVVKFLRQFVPTEEEPASTKRSSRRQIGLMAEDDDDEVGVTMHDGAMEMTPVGGSAPVAETIANVGAWFFQSIDIKSCKIKIDYRPNHVDYAALRAGDYLEVINLFVLEGMELVLRRVQMSGLDGWAALGEHVLISWVQDISRHQIHKCVASVSMPPLRPFVNIGAGAADLILLPIEHYGRDRRLVRGLKKGASSFLKSVTIETLNTASKVAQGTQALLEHADDVVSSSSALRRKQLKYRQAGSRIARNSRRMGGGGIRNAQDTGGGIGGRQYLAQQPANAAEGFGQAYDSLARELHVAAKTIVAVPLVEYKKTGSQGYVRSVIRAVPVAVLRPMIGASEAVAKALIGVRNAVDPELKEDIENKFKDFRAI